MMTHANRFLSQVMKRIRSGAPVLPVQHRFSVRSDRAGGGAFAQVWFLTRGCTWDRSGTCTMCNYGHGPDVTEQAMVEAVQEALGTIEGPVDELLVSPSGCMLDPAEVPPSARLDIYKCVAAFRAPMVCLETRAETVTPDVVAELVDILAEKDIAVELGVESSSRWIQRFCVNKGGDPSRFAAAAALLKKHGIRVYANVSLGTAFLTSSEAIEDAVRSVQWTLEHGADVALLFPLHVKPHTLLDWLHRRKLYHPPSLWSLIEVLSRLAPALLSRVNISWYRNNNGSGEDVILSPATCPSCQAYVCELLDRFREKPSPSTLLGLKSAMCECRELWRQGLATIPLEPLPERVLRQYEALATDLGLADSWAAHREGIHREALGWSSTQKTHLSDGSPER